jgi:ubiquinone/menaquinone biosynthesis C-methylase UbiE
MSWYDDRVLPTLTNLACATKPTRKQREKLVPLASGDILEIGFGSGLNLPFYNRDQVKTLRGLEPSAGMLRLAEKRISDSGINVELIELPGEEIPLASDSIDTVLVTYTLCTIPDVLGALEGMRRVLKPGGQLLYCEHGKAPDSRVEQWQGRLNPAWKKFSGGCNMNRDIPELLNQAGFSIVDDNRMYIPGPRALSYNYWGRAKIK